MFFLTQKDKQSKFDDFFFQADIFEETNTVNLSLQGKDDILTSENLFLLLLLSSLC